jgi:hypothetical protein
VDTHVVEEHAAFVFRFGVEEAVRLCRKTVWKVVTQIHNREEEIGAQRGSKGL